MAESKPNYTRVTRATAPILDLTSPSASPSGTGEYARVHRVGAPVLDLANSTPQSGGAQWEVTVNVEGSDPKDPTRTLLLTASVENGKVIVTVRPKASNGDGQPQTEDDDPVQWQLGEVPSNVTNPVRVTVGLREAS